ncbi:FG-GAP-like repeat-containing protein [Sphaerisporangium rhizosphaerae]|uniref:FG-GAP-like repeat-containing protein n=1 Tax=Sphaerisporangium rhizosphaerae TaxID=2269375 RepID=A0ABW2P8M1_9ACTN
MTASKRRFWIVLAVVAALIVGEVTTGARAASAAPATDLVLDFAVPDFDRAAAERAYSSLYETSMLDEIFDDLMSEGAAGGQVPGPLPEVPADIPGTLQITDTGFRIVISKDDISASASSFVNWIIIIAASTAAGALTLLGCFMATANPYVCKSLAGATTAVTGRFVAAKLNGEDMSTPQFWGTVIAAAIIGALAGAFIEFVTQFSKANSEAIFTAISEAISKAVAWLGSWATAGVRAAAEWFRGFMPQVGREVPPALQRELDRLGQLPPANLRIMPMGDSITRGVGGSPGGVGYRLGLLQRLQKDGHGVDYVGSLDDGAGSISDTDHEGHHGWRIDQVDAVTECAILSYLPNVVTLHLGTNDMSQNFDVGAAPARLARLIREITNVSRTTVVLVATLVPSLDGTINSRIRAYNSRLAATVTTLAAEGRRVRLVGMGAVTSADMNDSLHPNANGYRKMAEAFHRAIRLAIDDRVIADPVPGGPWSCGPAPGGPPENSGPEPASPGWNPIGEAASGVGAPSDHVRLADMDGDGLEDYLVVQDEGQVRAWLNNGAAAGKGWTWKGEIATGVGYPRDQIRFADMNGDGLDDYLVVQDQGQVRAWLNNGAAAGKGWTWKGEIATGVGYPRDQIRFADMNGDGLDDYLVVQDQGQVRAWYNNGAAAGEGWTWKGEIASGVGATRDMVRLQDINGDRRADYLVVQDDGTIRAWLNDLGGRGWIWQGTVIPGVGATRAQVRLHDLNGDHQDDYLVFGELGQIRVWINQRPTSPVPGEW